MILNPLSRRVRRGVSASLLFATALSLAACASPPPPAATHTVVPHRVELLSGDGQALTMGQLRGHAVLLDFWATWCPPCRVEAPIVDQVAKRWHDRGVVVVGVDTDTPDQGDPREFALSHGLSYPIVQDVAGQASRLYEIASIPTLVVLSRSGKVVAVRTGVTDDGELERLLRQAQD